jgi:hypothetical protein
MVIVWKSNKQFIVVLSTTQAEYISLFKGEKYCIDCTQKKIV